MIKLMVHQWQDIALATSTCVFNIALLPSVFGKHKPALGTCALTATFLCVNITAYFTLRLWYAAAMAFINLCLWATLLIQVYMRERVKTKRSK
jgi:tryptophan-rich sensory protein